MTLLELRFVAGSGEEAGLECYMEWESALRSPRSLMRQVETHAPVMFPDAVQVKATYVDPDGDECVLTEMTAEDAVSNAKEDSDRRVLRVRLADNSGGGNATKEVALAGEGGSLSPDGSCSHSGQRQLLNVVVECGGELRQDRVDFEAALDSPMLLVECVDRLGRELLPAAIRLLATYTDDDGDACTLSAPTSADAMALALERGSELRVLVSDAGTGQGATASQASAASDEVISHTFRRPRPRADIGVQAARQELEEARARLEEASQTARDKDQAICELQLQLLAKQVEADKVQMLEAAVALKKEEAVAQAAAMAQQAEEFQKQLELQASQKDAEAGAALQDALKEAEEAYSQDKLLLEQRATEAAMQAEKADKHCQEQAVGFSEQIARIERAAATTEMGLRSELEAAEVKMQDELEQANKKVVAAEEASREARVTEAVEAAQASKAQEEAVLLQECLGKLEADVAGLQAELQGKAQSELLLRDLQAELEDARREASEAQRQADIYGRAAALARVKTAWEAKMSAVVVRSEPEFAVVEGDGEDPAARGDVSKDFVQSLHSLGARQAFRIGRMRLAAAGDDDGGRRESFPACYSVIVENNGQEPWPATSALVHASGEALDLPVLPLGPVGPGQRAEVQMDLRIPQAAMAATTAAASMWVLRDAATSKPLGPVLIFEVQWVESSSV